MKGIRVVIEVDPFEVRESDTTLSQLCDLVRELNYLVERAAGSCEVRVDCAAGGGVVRDVLRTYGVPCSPMPKPRRR